MGALRRQSYAWHVSDASRAMRKWKELVRRGRDADRLSLELSRISSISPVTPMEVGTGVRVGARGWRSSGPASYGKEAMGSSAATPVVAGSGGGGDGSGSRNGEGSRSGGRSGGVSGSGGRSGGGGGSGGGSVGRGGGGGDRGGAHGEGLDVDGGESDVGEAGDSLSFYRSPFTVSSSSHAKPAGGGGGGGSGGGRSSTRRRLWDQA